MSCGFHAKQGSHLFWGWGAGDKRIPGTPGASSLDELACSRSVRDTEEQYPGLSYGFPMNVQVHISTGT